MVTTEELGSRVVADVDAQVERSLEVRRHHGVVGDDQSVLRRAKEEQKVSINLSAPRVEWRNGR